jgi:hypothetical protein
MHYTVQVFHFLSSNRCLTCAESSSRFPAFYSYISLSVPKHIILPIPQAPRFVIKGLSCFFLTNLFLLHFMSCFMILLSSQLTKSETQAFLRFLIFCILFLQDHFLWFCPWNINHISFFSTLHKPRCLSLSPHQISSTLMQLSPNLSPSIQSSAPLIHSLSYC